MDRVQIFNEDCRVLLGRDIPYHYVLTSPPDFLEVGLTAKDQEPYVEFLKGVYSLFKPVNGVVSLLMTDKKKDGKIYTKHITNIDIMRSLGWELISEKIWVRTLSANLYESTYSFVLSFSKGKCYNGKHSSYLPDVFLEKRDAGIQKFKHRHIGLNSFPASLGERFVLNFTREGETVCDPFMGIGGTALSALPHGRNVLGSELQEETHRLCLKRIEDPSFMPDSEPEETPEPEIQAPTDSQGPDVLDMFKV